MFQTTVGSAGFGSYRRAARVHAATSPTDVGHQPNYGWCPNVDDLVVDLAYFDVELGYQLNDNWRLVLGGVNVTDEFIDEIGPPNSNRLSVGLQYPRRTVANYEGGSWYLRGSYSW